jgi:hypothetical protein
VCVDLWAPRWRRKRAHGDVIIVRLADDFIVGFEYRPEAEQFLAELRERFAKFGLDLHPDTTRIIEFGRYAERDRGSRGDGKPATFNFLASGTVAENAQATLVELMSQYVKDGDAKSWFFFPLLIVVDVEEFDFRCFCGLLLLTRCYARHTSTLTYSAGTAAAKSRMRTRL